MCQHLAIGKSEVGRASHGMEVLLAFGRVKRSADQLAIGQLNAVIMYRLLKAADVVLTTGGLQSSQECAVEGREQERPDRRPQARRVVTRQSSQGGLSRRNGRAHGRAGEFRRPFPDEIVAIGEHDSAYGNGCLNEMIRATECMWARTGGGRG
jgi:hypothetical protein